MVYGVIDKKNHRHYTYLSKVFSGLGSEQNNYNWLICDCECYPSDKETEDMLDREYCWLSGEELTALVEKEDFQWIWAVLCGFEKYVTLEEILEYPLPCAEDYNGYYKNPLALQHPLSSIEIVPCDSSWTLILSNRKDITDRYMRVYPNNQDLTEFNEKQL